MNEGELATDPRPIGVFDSGLGGLTVAAAIRRRLPSEELVYLGDTARVPYGTRSAETVVRYARSCAATFTKDDIKAFVVACNTVSAVALDSLRVELDVPVLGVIVPGARAGWKASKRRRIGVLATPGTVASGAYGRAMASIDSRAELMPQAAPLLVPLAEELEAELQRRGRRAPPRERANLHVRVTDLPGRFEDVASRFLGEDLGEVQAIDLR